MSEYVNPDSPNPDVTADIVRSMQMGSRMPTSPQTYGYYPGPGYQNPFGYDPNFDPDSRRNLGPMPNAATMAQYNYPNHTNPQIPPELQALNIPPLQQNRQPDCPPYPGNQCQSTYPSYIQQQQYPQQTMPYNGLPMTIGPDDYIGEYMKSTVGSKLTWGENYWTTPKAIDPPFINWGQPTYQQSSQPQNYSVNPYYQSTFSLPPYQPTFLDVAKSTWRDL